MKINEPKLYKALKGYLDWESWLEMGEEAEGRWRVEDNKDEEEEDVDIVRNLT